MIEYWAVLGLAAIDPRFFKEIKDKVDANNFDGVAQVLMDYNFRLSLYEAGEVIRLFRYPSVQKCLMEIQEKWDNGRVCTSASSKKGFFLGQDYLHAVFELSPSGEHTVKEYELASMPIT
jgi:hypothetical protein